MADEAPVIKKKIKPYPIDLELVGTSVVKGQILKLANTGFLSDLQGQFVEVGEIYSGSFVIPVLNIKISSKFKVIKTYDHYVPDGMNKKIIRIVECHAMNYTDQQVKAINGFLDRIGQK